MTNEQIPPGEDGRLKDFDFLGAEERATRKTRRGSVASFFEQVTNQNGKPRDSANETDNISLATSQDENTGTLDKEKVQPDRAGRLNEKGSIENLDFSTDEKTKHAKTGPVKGNSRKKRKTFHDIEPPLAFVSNVECLDVTESKWVQDPEDANQEIVTLTGEISGQDSETANPSFRWIHYQRETSSITFEDFEKILEKDQGLYEDEAAVASKCIKEAKKLRRTFARGKYFEPIIHQTSDVMGNSVEQVPISATFICMPIFALMNRSEEHLPYLPRHALRTPARHPIRSLLQYSNLVALDTQRDTRQVAVVTTLDEDEPRDTKPFIHVPEFWAIVINMYTVITCAPFSSGALRGENIRIRKPPTKEQRLMVKYTSLRGTLHDLRCNSWLGLLDSISRIEWHIHDIELYLRDPASQYKIIDLRYHQVDEVKWERIVESAGTRSVDIRLVQIPENSILTLEFAARKLRACVHATWILLGLPHQLDRLEARLLKLRVEGADEHSIDAARKRIAQLSETEQNIRRSRFFNRMLLYAARSHIISPRQRLSSAARKAKTRRAFGRVMMASKLATGGQSSTLNAVPESRDSSSPALFENKRKIPEIKLQRPVTPTGDPFSSSFPKVIFPDASHLARILTGDERSGSRRPLSTAIPQLTLATSQSTYDPDLEAQRLPSGVERTDNIIEYRDAFENTQSTRPLQSPVGSKLGLWEFQSDMSLDRMPISIDGQKASAIVDPYSSELSGITQQELPYVGISLKGQPLQLRPQYATSRRHTSFGVPGELLLASPQRLPLRIEDPSIPARRVSHSSTRPSKDSRRRESRTSVPVSITGPFADQPQEDTQNEVAPLTLSKLVKKRATDNIGSHVPFFQWPMETPLAIDGRLRTAQARQGAVYPSPWSRRLTNAQAESEEPRAPETYGANEILSDVNSFIYDGKYYDETRFPVGPSDYTDVVVKSETAVISILQREYPENDRLSFEVAPEDDPIGAQRLFLDTKVQLLLSVHGFIECFVHQENIEAEVIGKIWGIMYHICELSWEKAELLAYPSKYDLKFVQYAAKEVEKMEHKCRELLQMKYQTEGTENTTGPTFHVPPSLFAAFMDFVLFLLCVHLAVTEDRVESETINIVRDKVHNQLHDTHSTFLRMIQRMEIDLDQIGYESIRAADSVLGLVVENALSISCKENAGIANDGGEMDFDIVHIYSRYTSHCIDRAKHEASARVYEDVRLLREEIDTISLVLKHQYNLFHRMLAARESPLQIIDKRFIYRVTTNLDEMIRHFSTLSDYAHQAEFWARNSIEVRSENNNKAIYVFTAVTVIFLPLSFVTGLLGMNTFDIRNMTHGVWLFFATSIPFTIVILIICLAIVNYKFKLKKRLRRFVLKSRVARGWRREWKMARQSVSNVYFRGPFHGYGLRLLVPIYCLQRWRGHKFRKEMHAKLKDED